MTVDVTQADIDSGIRWKSTEDPIAQAMRRAFAIELWGAYTPIRYAPQEGLGRPTVIGGRRHPDLAVTGRHAYVVAREEDGGGWNWTLPVIVGDWLRAYDSERPVQPISFDVPSLSLCECGVGS